MKKTVLIYELFMSILIGVAIIVGFSDNPSSIKYDWIIWGAFMVDYFIHLLRSKNKWKYIKSHPLELVAIIPLDSVFRLARFARVFRMLRLIEMESHYFRHVFAVLKTNGLDRLIEVTLVLLFLVPIPIIAFEPGVETYADALWWAIVTTTTVGYGDISPVSTMGRIIAIILMVVGIGVIGTLISAISSYFVVKEKLTKDQKLLKVMEVIDSIEDINQQDVELVMVFLQRKNKT